MSCYMIPALEPRMTQAEIPYEVDYEYKPCSQHTSEVQKTSGQDMRRFRHFRARSQLMSQLADLNSFGIQKLLRTVPDGMTELGNRVQTTEVAFDRVMPDIAPVRSKENSMDLQPQQQRNRDRKPGTSPPQAPPLTPANRHSNMSKARATGLKLAGPLGQQK